MQTVSDADDLPDAEALKRWPLAVIAQLDIHFERDRELAVRVIDADEARALNLRYRQRDYATNVLSFPADAAFEIPGDEALPLGDLILCAPVIAREAAEQGKPPAAHWAHLLVHGTLHLLGHDHQTDAEAERMEALEVAILAAHGIANPYIEAESGR